MSTPSIEDLTRSSSFVFLGTVELRGASNLVAVDPRDQLVLVRVDRPLRVDPAVGDVTGRSVTLETLDDAGLVTGVQAVFFTTAWIHAEEIAVREVARVAPEQADDVAAAVARLPDLHLADRLADAVAVVQAEVQATRPVLGLVRDRQSPLWAQADLDVLSTLEGNADGKRLFFPTSDSHHWYDAPKLYAGQRGIIVLHADDPLAGKWLDGAGADVVTALDPADVQPESELEHVRALLAGGDA